MTENSGKAVLRMGPHGVQPKSMEEAWRLCTAIAKSGLAPKSFDSPEKVFVAVQTGAERGWTPMQSLQYLYVVNGRVSIWGDAALAECRKSGLFVEDGFEEWLEVDGKRVVDIGPDDTGARAVCQTLRKGAKKPLVRSFSVANAIRAGLWKKSGPWQNYPGRMLQYKARSWNLRDNFPDVLMGIHTVEELQGEPLEVQAVSLDDLPAPKPDDLLVELVEGKREEAINSGNAGATAQGAGEPGEKESDAVESPDPSAPGPAQDIELVTSDVAKKLDKERKAKDVPDETWADLLERTAGVRIVTMLPADKAELVGDTLAVWAKEDTW